VLNFRLIEKKKYIIENNLNEVQKLPNLAVPKEKQVKRTQKEGTHRI
jgi:hypothetical protein